MPGSHLEPVQHTTAKVHLEFEMVGVSPMWKDGHKSKVVHKLLHLATAFSKTRRRIGVELPLCSPQHIQVGSMLGAAGKHEHLLTQGQAKQIATDEKAEWSRLLPLCGEVDHPLGQMFEGVQVAKRTSCLHYVGKYVSGFLCMGEGRDILVGKMGTRGTCGEVR